MPPPRRRAPTTNESRSSSRVIRRAERPSRARLHPRSSRPASRNRPDAMMKAGIVSTATLIPMYVEPHTK
jgi:hypothetical protein